MPLAVNATPVAINESESATDTAAVASERNSNAGNNTK
jgi:hypothetical protein